MDMNMNIDSEYRNNFYVVLLLLVVSYFLINLLKKSKEYGDYLKIFATPEKMIINLVFILAITLWIKMPTFFGDDNKENFMSFIFIVVAIGYTILAVIGDLKNKMIQFREKYEKLVTPSSFSINVFCPANTESSMKSE